jgi:hypothetical protein
MPAARKEAERVRAQSAALVLQYRAIGPAAIVAALIHARSRRPIPSARKAA